MAALQFFLLNEADHADAWQRYLKLCRMGGTASYTELCRAAGLRTPFEEGAVKAIAQPVAAWTAGLRTPFEEGAVKAIAQPVAAWIAAHQV